MRGLVQQNNREVHLAGAPTKLTELFDMSCSTAAVAGAYGTHSMARFATAQANALRAQWLEPVRLQGRSLRNDSP